MRGGDRSEPGPGPDDGQDTRPVHRCAISERPCPFTCGASAHRHNACGTAREADLGAEQAGDDRRDLAEQVRVADQGDDRPGDKEGHEGDVAPQAGAPGDEQADADPG